MSLLFDGVNDIVSSSATQTLGAAVTLAAWVNATSDGEGDAGRILVQGDGLGSRLALMMIPTVTVRFLCGRATTDGEWDLPNDSLTLGAWHHLAVTYDGASTSNDPLLYVNGVEVGESESATPSGNQDADDKTVRVGNASGTDRTFDGLIAEAAVWTRVLSPAEVAAVCRVGVLAAPTLLHLYWPLGHISGDATALDFSGNDRDGAVTGAVNGANPPIRPGGRRG